ncbi:hypothetical protein LG293_09995 [Citricoccus nitrophenolicus]
MHGTTRTTLRRARVAATLAIASIALTSCASTVRESSAINTTNTPPAREHSTSPSAAAVGELAPTETQSTEAVQITGDFQIDVLATGAEPVGFDDAMA